MERFDITFTGHVCFDEIVPYGGKRYVAPGSAVLQGAMAAARIGKRVAVITRMAKKDEPILEMLKENGVTCFLLEAPETSWMYVGHPSANVDEREMILKYSAGAFRIGEFPEIKTGSLHLAGISNREFTVDFIRGLHSRGYNLSVDLQSFVRQADPVSGKVVYGDDERKQEIVSLMQKVKLDVVEAGILTGTTDLEEASWIIGSWGCPEVVITRADGVLANINGQVLWEPFTNRSVAGRTGRGDTSFAGYLSSRLDHEPEWSLKFAASLVSLKMEKAGPFTGSLDQVLERMKLDRRL